MTATSGRSNSPALVLHDLVRRFVDVSAVDGVNLEVRDGEFLTLLGPSGSGKTTTLRMIAGFLSPSSGSIEIGGNDRYLSLCRRHFMDRIAEVGGEQLRLSLTRIAAGRS